MSLIPINEPQEPEVEPKIFYLYGGTMSGKSFTAMQFPEPLVLNTDGNGKKFSAPSIDITPDREMVTKKIKVTETDKKTGVEKLVTKTVKSYDIITPTHEKIDKVLGELAVYQQTSKKPYRTLVIDVVDDIANSEQEFVLQYFNQFKKSDKIADYEYIGDIPHAGGWGRFNDFFRTIIRIIREFGNGIEYIVFISRQVDRGSDDMPDYKPAIREGLVNEINGFGDMMIHCQKLGKNYSRSVKYTRNADFESSHIQNEQVLEVLKNTRNALIDYDGKGNKKEDKKKVGKK